MKTIDINGRGPTYYQGRVVYVTQGAPPVSLADMYERLAGAMRMREQLDAAINNTRALVRECEESADRPTSPESTT